MSKALTHFSCEETFRRLDDFLDRELSAAEIQSVEAHLGACEMCMREFRFEAGVLRGVREKLPRLSAPPDLLARISARIARVADETEPR